MKQGYKYFFLVAMAIVLLAAACSKGGTPTNDDGNGNPHVENQADTIAPVIIINTPILDQVYTSGTIINVTGRITDDFGLYRGTIRITNDADGALLKEQQYEIHGLLAYNFNISYTTAVTAISDYTVRVTFEDHGYNSASKSVKVKVNP